MIECIQTQIRASITIKEALINDLSSLERVERLAELCLAALRGGGKVIFAGNGGSFADAQHLSAEFVSRFMFDRAPLASLALGTNNSALSAISNDYGYDKVFSRELAAVARPADVFIPISTSGTSPNVLAAIDTARRLGIATLGLTGQGGGRMKDLCDCIRIPATDTARIQECHIMVGHIVCGLVEARYFGGAA